MENRYELDDIISQKTRNWEKLNLLKQCEENGIPAGPINSLDEVFADEHIVHRGMRLNLQVYPVSVAQ